MPFIDASLALPDGEQPLLEAAANIEMLLLKVPNQGAVQNLVWVSPGSPLSELALKLDDAASAFDRRIILSLGKTAGIVSVTRSLEPLKGYLSSSLKAGRDLAMQLRAQADVLAAIGDVFGPLIPILQELWGNFAAIGSVLPYVREAITLLKAPMRLIRWFRAQLMSGGPPPDRARIVAGIGSEDQQDLDRMWLGRALDIVDGYGDDRPLHLLSAGQREIVTDWTRLVMPAISLRQDMPPGGRPAWDPQWQRFRTDFGEGQTGHGWAAQTVDPGSSLGNGIVPGLPWIYGAWQQVGEQDVVEPISVFMPVSRRVAVSLWSRISSGSPESLRVVGPIARRAWRAYWESLLNDPVLDAGVPEIPEQTGPRILLRSNARLFAITDKPDTIALPATDGSGLWVSWYGQNAWHQDPSGAWRLKTVDEGGFSWINDIVEYLRGRAGIIEARARDDAAQGELLGRIADTTSPARRTVELCPWYVIEDALLALELTQRTLVAKSIAAAYASPEFAAVRLDTSVRLPWQQTRRSILENDAAVRQVEWSMVPDAEYRAEVYRRQLMPAGGLQLAAAPVKPGKPPGPKAAVFELGAAAVDPPFPPSGEGVGGAPGPGASSPGADTGVAVRPAASRSTTPSWLLPVGLLAAGAGAAYVYRRKLSG
jgi:hypothetical protein